MPFLVSRARLIGTERTVAPGGTPVTLRVNQPVVWVRLVPWVGDPEPGGVAFPAVVDTGNNHSFLIPAPLFRSCTRIDPNQLRPLRTIEANGLFVGCYGFNIELLRLRRGVPTGQVAARLEADRGIVIVPDSLVPRFPRMPVLGVRCLTVNLVTLTLNGARETFSLWQSR